MPKSRTLCGCVNLVSPLYIFPDAITGKSIDIIFAINFHNISVSASEHKLQKTQNFIVSVKSSCNKFTGNIFIFQNANTIVCSKELRSSYYSIDNEFLLNEQHYFSLLMTKNRRFYQLTNWVTVRSFGMTSRATCYLNAFLIEKHYHWHYKTMRTVTSKLKEGAATRDRRKNKTSIVSKKSVVMNFQ